MCPVTGPNFSVSVVTAAFGSPIEIDPLMRRISFAPPPKRSPSKSASTAIVPAVGSMRSSSDAGPVSLKVVLVNVPT